MIQDAAGPEWVLPADFEQRMIGVHGEAGARWIRRLPRILDDLREMWSVDIGPPFEPLSYHVVASADQGAQHMVIKLGVPGPDLAHEAQALKDLAGESMVRLLELDEDRGAMLLERLVPGTSLKDLADDQQATQIAAVLMGSMPRYAPPPGAFPTVSDWAAGLQRLRDRFGGETGPIEAGLVEAAERVYAELLPSSGPPVLLHGDFHHDNILWSDRRGWVAIDPQGVVGEPEYEVGVLLHNPFPEVASWPDLKGIMARRLDQLAEVAGFDRQRILGWGLAQAVLSACWDLEDHGMVQPGHLVCAEVLFSLTQA